MSTNRRTFLGTVAAFVSYVLLASGIVKPKITVERFLRCGNNGSCVIIWTQDWRKAVRDDAR